MADLRPQPGSNLVEESDERRRVCPLCKRPLDAEAFGGADTRLCNQCRFTVQSILPAPQQPVDAKPSRPQSSAVPGRNGDPAQSEKPKEELFRWPDPLDTNPLSTEQSISEQNDLLRSQLSVVSPIKDPSGFRIGEANALPDPRSAATDSVDEWQLIADDDSEPKSSSVPWKLILVLVVIALGGAAGYYAYRTYIAPRLNQTQIDAKNSVPPASAAAPSQPAQKSQPTSAQTTSSGGQTNPQPAGQAASSIESGGGMFALQASSVPNEASAKEFSEKLIRSGIAAYVVAADLGKRGKWYRVRVGRFDDRNEAAKFAEQSRQRARAAGLNLQLMVCDYEKP